MRGKNTSARYVVSQMKRANATSCHADVKPDNILRVQGNFKLADFGFAKFMPGTVGSGLVEEATTSLVGGTATYGKY